MSKVSFGMIVKNGAPWVKYCLESVYEFAHEIIVIDGGSTDDTLKIARDAGSKVRLIRGEYADKNDQCNEYMKLATGDFVWQLDSDEIYKREDVAKAIMYLGKSDEEVFCINIVNFFRDLNHVVKGGLWSDPPVRIFRRIEGDLYCSHRPPTVVGINGRVIKSIGLCLPEICIYHYSHVGVEQVRRKAAYFAKAMKDHPVYSRYMDWFNNVYLDKSRMTKLHITGEGDLSFFKGIHPEVIEQAIYRGELNEYMS